MGARASFFIIKEGRTKLYYAHWGADSLVRNAFFGPAATEKYLEIHEEVDWMLDETHAEAGAILDLDAKRFTFYCTHTFYHAEFRRYFLPLMQTNWPGWKLHWALGGIVEIAELLGRDPAPFRDVLEETDSWFDPPKLIQPPRYLATLVSIREGDLVRDLEFEDEISNLLAMGPAILAVTRAWPHAARVSSANWQDVEEGCILDCDARRISAWDITGNHLDCCRKVLQDRWPGWQLEVHHDGLPGQWSRSGRDPTPVSCGEAEVLGHVLEILTECPQEVHDHLAALRDGNRVDPAVPDGEAALIARSIAEYRRRRLNPPPAETIA